MADRTVLVRLDAVINPYVTKMAEASAATRKLSQAEKDVKQATVDLGRNFQRAGTALTLGLTVPFIAVVKHASDVAMTAQETENKVTVAFGAMEDAVHQWSEGSARSMGLARHEAEGAAATFGTMFSAMGLGRKKAFELSTGVVKLAADLGSFFDVDPTEMLERIRSGLVGEIEPLRRVGILLTDQAVRQKAVSIGLADSTDQVSEAAKVQARYALIVDQSSKANGDYARTADSATNSMRTARAAYEDAMVQLGNHLLPLIAKGAQTITALAEAFSALPGPVQAALFGFGAILATAGPLLVAFGSIIRNLDTISKMEGKLGTLGRMGAGAVGVIAYAEAVQFLSKSIHDLLSEAPRIDQTTVALINLAEGVGTWKQVADAASETQKKIKEMIELVNEGAVTKQKSGLGRQLDDIDKGLAAMVARGAPEVAQRSLRAVAEALDIKPRDLLPWLDDYAASLGSAAAEAKLAAAATDEVGAESSDAAMDVDKLTKALDDLYSSTFSAQEASDRFASDLATFVDSVRTARVAGDQWATSLDAGTETGRGNRDMLRGLVGDLFDYAGSAGASAAQTAAMREQLVGVLTQLGFSRTEAEQFTAVLSNLSGLQVVPKVDIDISGAESKISSLERRWALSSVSQAARAWGGVAGSASAPAVAALPTGPGPKEQAELDRQKSERESATRDYLQAVKDAEEERKRLEEDLSRFLKAVYDHQREIEDNQFEFHVMSKDRYLEILRQRLVGLEEYSDAWVAVMRQIQEVQGEALDAQLEVIKAYEAGRQFQLGFDQLAGQRAWSDAHMVAATSYGSSSSSTVSNSKSLELNLNMTTSNPERVTADSLRAAALAGGF